jgi:hypothetical protein
LRRQHAHADLFDEVPDAVDVVFLAHVEHYIAATSSYYDCWVRLIDPRRLADD